MDKYISIIYWKDSNLEKKKKVLSRPVLNTTNKIQSVVKKIISDVKCFGDTALYNYTKMLDKIQLDSIKIDKFEITNSQFLIDNKIKESIYIARNNIKKFHKQQVFNSINVEIQSGVFCQQITRPIESIGLYIPGGCAPLVSTVLMLAVPASIAGCKNIILCSPPPITPEILYASNICGIHNIFQIGGAQAISAMAFGTETIPKVNKIFGPGNVYVTEAKSQVNMLLNDVSIDMLAGPSEVLIIADSSANCSVVASDLLAQMEHGDYSQAILVTPCCDIANNVMLEINKQLKFLSRKNSIYESLKYSSIIIAENLLECFKISNYYAPEHLMIQCEHSQKLLIHVTNAGSVFLGHWASVAGGDYATGTNHVLPTYGSALFDSGLTLKDFQKTISVQKLNKKGFINISSVVLSLSKVERMDAHSNSIKMRMSTLQDVE